MSALDTIAGVGAGCYLLAVAVNGNSKALIETAKRDKGFIKWAIAVALLMYALRYKKLAEPVALIIVTAFLGLFLQNGTKIADQANAFWESLSSQ